MSPEPPDPDDAACFGDAPDPLAALAEEHARALDAECAAYLAAHGDEMRAELAAAAATWREGGR